MPDGSYSTTTEEQRRQKSISMAAKALPVSALRDTTQKCMQLFGLLCAAFDGAPTKYAEQMPLRTILDEFDRFKIWSGNLGARQKGHASLDWRLRDAEVMTTSIRKLLNMLGEQLENGTRIRGLISKTTSEILICYVGYDVLAQKRPPYEEQNLDFGNVSNDSDSDDSGEQQPELAQRLQTIVATVKSLYKLSYTIRRLGTRVVSQKAELYRDLIPGSELEYGEGFHPLDRDHVVNLLNDLRRVALTSSEDRDVNDQRSRHPDASEEPLTDRLTSAITKRRRKFRYWKSHKEKLAQVATVEIKESKQDSMPQGQERTIGAVIGKSKPDATASARSRDPRTETEATRYVPASSDQADVVSIAPSASTARDLDGHEAMLPAPPETHGQDWECQLCFVLCPEKEAIGSRWR
jgi:hypothetical protein